MTKSFLTQDDRKMLEALDRRYEAGRRRAWLLPLALLVTLLPIFGSLLLTSIRQADKVATHSVPANEVLHDFPANKWLRGTQAAVHNRFTWGLDGLVGSALISCIVVVRRVFLRVVVRAWRTVKFLEDGVVSPEQVVLPSRPPRRGRSRIPLFASMRLSNAQPISAEKRFTIYKRARADASRLKTARPVVYGILTLCILIYGALPICMALSLNAPWYYPCSMLLAGYEPAQTYTVWEISAVDHAILAAAFVPPFFLVLLLLRPLSSHGRLTSILLVAEMRRLDVLLWRKAGGKKASS
jgi:hypothetical protein